jgi:hypothetical protein
MIEKKLKAIRLGDYRVSVEETEIDLSSKADLVDGKVPSEQLPDSAEKTIKIFQTKNYESAVNLSAKSMQELINPLIPDEIKNKVFSSGKTYIVNWTFSAWNDGLYIQNSGSSYLDTYEGVNVLGVAYYIQNKDDQINVFIEFKNTASNISSGEEDPYGYILTAEIILEEVIIPFIYS